MNLFNRKSKLIFIIFVIVLFFSIVSQDSILAEDSSPNFENYVFYSSWGGEGKQILRPEGVAVGEDGKIYIANTEFNRITIIDQNGSIIKEVGGFGENNGEFSLPLGVAVNTNGEIFVVDTWNRRIQKFDKYGNHLLTWGELGEEPGQFWGPIGITFDNDENVYIVDSGNSRIQKFTTNGEFIETFGEYGDGDNQFNRPRDIAINSNGEIFITDSGNYRVQIFTSNWEFLKTIQIEDPASYEDYVKPLSAACDSNNQLIITGEYKLFIFDSDYNLVKSWGGKGKELGKFQYPVDITVDKKGIIFVADSSNNRIQVFDLNGNLLNHYGIPDKMPGYFDYPRGITIVDDYIYVADSFNDRIQKFNQDGTYLLSWGISGKGLGEFNGPYGIAGDSQGNIYVTDSGNHRVQEFNQNGEFLKSWGEKGSEVNQFLNPSGIAIDNNDNIFVLDEKNHRVQKFNSLGNFITSWGSFGAGEGQFYGPRDLAVDSNGNIFVADTANNRVQKFNNDGLFLKEWDFIKDPGYLDPVWIEGVSVDSHDNIYISGTFIPEIQKYSNNGEYLGKFGKMGNKPGEFAWGPKMVFNEEDVLFASDTENQRIQVISPFHKNIDPEFGLIINGGFELPTPLLTKSNHLGVGNSQYFYLSTNTNSLEIPELNKWTYGGSLPISISTNAQQGSNSLQIGNLVEQEPQGKSDAWAYQVIYLRPEWVLPILSFQYNVITNELMDKSDFFVEIQDGFGLNHLDTVVRDGYISVNGIDLPEPATNLGWKSISFDLSKYRGQTIRLTFSNRNLSPDSKGIWTYLDNVAISNESETIYLPLINR